MMLWLVMALMTAAAIFAVLWPLARRAPLRAGSDIAVYRDQLEEIERDRTAGLIGERESEAARIEVSRRLIAAADAAPSPMPRCRRPALWRRRAAALAAIVLLPLGAHRPLSQRSVRPICRISRIRRGQRAGDDRSIVELVGRVEAHLQQNPEDGRGWEVLAPVYMRLGRYDDAVKARRTALQLLGESSGREADLGEAMIGVANGIVTGDAKAAFDRAPKLDAGEVKARYFLGLAAEQDGRRDEAVDRVAQVCWRRRAAGRSLGRPGAPICSRASIQARQHPRRAARATSRSRRRSRCRRTLATRWCAAWLGGSPSG